MPLARTIAAMILTMSLASCGGGGGSIPADLRLVANIGSLQGQHLALGDPRQLQQTSMVSQWLNRLNWSQWSTQLASLFMGSAHAQQITVAACANTTLMGTLDAIHWAPVGLTTDTKTNGCIQQMQDAGRFLVLKASNITNSAGQLCDLITIAKSTGDTACIRLDVPNRSVSGAPQFNLGINLQQWNRQGQLSANGQYFFIGFLGTENRAVSYSGFLRLDLSGVSPVPSLAYYETGPQSTSDWTINGHHNFWASFWPQNNGDLVFAQYTPDNASMSSGQVDHYHVIYEPELSDPLLIKKALFNSNTTSADPAIGGYQIQPETSRLAAWIKAQYSSVGNMFFDSEVLPNPDSAASEHAFYIIANASNIQANSCPLSDRLLIKVTTDPTTQQVQFEDLGSTGLGNGWGSSPDSTDIMIDPNNSTHLVSITVQATGGGSDTVTANRLTRQLSASNCDQNAAVSPIITASAEVLNSSQNLRNLSSFVNETRAYLFLRTVNNNESDTDSLNRCVQGQGCLIDATSLFLAYDKAANTVKRIDLTPIHQGDYRLKAAISSATSDKVYLVLNKSPANTTVYAELTQDGVRNLIELPAGINLRSIIVSGS
jgi:hypothetical protein